MKYWCIGNPQLLAIILAGASLSGCTHLKGVVVESPSGRPLITAKLDIGRPGSLANYGSHPVDGNGRFDFYISPTDTSMIFVYDGAAAPERTMRRLDQSELNDHMRLEIERMPADPTQGLGLRP